MKVFKKKGELTKFQILAEIAKGQPHLRQKDIADQLGITVQAVSENLKTLVDEGWVETGSGQARYKITKRGIEKVKTGGYIIADNTLWNGKVTGVAASDDFQTQGIQTFNDLVKNDPRVEKVILPLRDGMTVIRKK